MNPDEFRTRIEQLADVQWRLPDQPAVQGPRYRLTSDQGPGATIQQLHLTPAKCDDCSIICTQRPRRDFQKRSHGWIERCRECGLWRNEQGTWGDLPYKKIGRPALKSTMIITTSDLPPIPDCLEAHQSLPIEHDANDSWSDPVDDRDHEQDL